MRILFFLFTFALSPTQAFAAPSDNTTPTCIQDRWAATLAPATQSVAPSGLWPHPDGQVVGFAFGPTASGTGKLFLFLLDNGACFSRAVMIGGANGQFRADLFRPEDREKIGSFAMAPDLATATRIAAEALK